VVELLMAMDYGGSLKDAGDAEGSGWKGGKRVEAAMEVWTASSKRTGSVWMPSICRPRDERALWQRGGAGLCRQPGGA